jgi:acetylglutamate kinase
MPENKADILIESLPFIRQFAGQTIVIKYGGHAMVDEQLKEDFAKDIALMKYVGLKPVVVHGGGPQINQVMDRMGIRPQFVRGMRLTDEDTMSVVEMVLGGKVNKSIVAQINRHGGQAVGLTGKDGELILAEKMRIVHREAEDAPPEIIDPGLVGKVTRINPRVIHTLVEAGFVPVIAPVGTGANGETYNINADLVASHVARALSALRLIYLTDVDGVLDREKKLIPTIQIGDIQKLIDDGTISGGMIPKVEYARAAVDASVSKVQIINGKKRHAVILELFTSKGVGTEVIR